MPFERDENLKYKRRNSKDEHSNKWNGKEMVLGIYVSQPRGRSDVSKIALIEIVLYG